MDINKVLEEIPAKKARASQEAEDLRRDWQEAKEVYAHGEAQYVLRMKAENEVLKSTEIKYFVNEDQGLYEKRLELIIKEAIYRHKEKDIEALDDEFTSAKMLARLKISELGTIEWSGK